MEELLGGLDPDQLRAVTHGEGPLLVVAGAGTGKTQVITRRIAWLIATRRAKPSEILALTFTDKAADEMAVRVDQLVPYGYTDTAIATFHAFGDRLIREFALELGLPPDVRVLSRAEAVMFLREHLFEFDLDAYRPLGDPTRFLSALVTLFSRCKDEDITPATYAAYAARVAAEAAAVAAAADDRARPTADAAEALAEEAAARPSWPAPTARYQELLAANGFIDFGDQVALALRLVRESAAARRRSPAVPLHPGRRVPGHEPRPGRAGGAARRAASERHGRRRRRPGDLCVPWRRDRQHPRLRGALSGRTDRGAAAELSLARTGPRCGVSARSGSTIPTGWRCGPGIAKRLRARRIDPAAPPVRLEAFATGSEEADWIAADIARRVAAGPRRGITRSSSARTATPSRSCGRSTSPACRGGSPDRPGCMPGPRSAC